MGTFFDSFMPALTGAVAQAPLAGAQGRVQGITTAMDLARLHAQIKQQQIANQQAQQSFPLQQQQLQQQLRMNAAPQWQVRQPGTTLEQIDPLTGRTTGQSRQVPLNPLQEAQSKMYTTGLTPAGTIEELMKRTLAVDPENPQALAYFAMKQRTKGISQGVSGPIDEESMRTMSDQGMIDPNYHPKFTGPYAAINQQNYEIFKARPNAQSGLSPSQQAAQNFETKTVASAKAKLYKDTVSDYGPNGAQGKQVRSFNVVLNHLKTLDGLAAMLHNRDFQGFNRMANAWGKFAGKKAPTSWDAAAKVVGDEIALAISGAGVTDAGSREDIARAISSNLTPEQWGGAGGVSDKYKELMTGKLSELKRSYLNGGGKNFEQFLSPTAFKVQGEMAKRDSEPSKSASKAPTIGQMEDGYLYKGGDPSKQESWEKVK